MKIKDAKPIYYANRKELVEQMRSLSKQKEEADKNYQRTGEDRFSDQAATLELSINATKEAFEENQKVIDSIMEQWSNTANMESSKQQGEAMEEAVKDMGKVLMVFRRLAHGDIVPITDERKLMEYDDKMYQVAKNMQLLAQQLEKDREKHKSLWKDEAKESPEDPMEIAENTEYAGELPNIEIPVPPVTTPAEGEGGTE